MSQTRAPKWGRVAVARSTTPSPTPGIGRSSASSLNSSHGSDTAPAANSGDDRTSAFSQATLSTVAAAKAMFSRSAKVPHAFAHASRPAPSKRRQPWANASTAYPTTHVGNYDQPGAPARARTAARIINTSTGELDHSPSAASRDSSAPRTGGGGLYNHSGLCDNDDLSRGANDTPAANATAAAAAAAGQSDNYRPSSGRPASPAPPSDEEHYVGTSAGSVGGTSLGSNGSIERELALNYALRPQSPVNHHKNTYVCPPKCSEKIAMPTPADVFRSVLSRLVFR